MALRCTASKYIAARLSNALHLALLTALVLCATSCPHGPSGKPASGSPQHTASGAGQPAAESPAGQTGAAGQAGGASTEAGAAPKQLILIYTGDTLSIARANGDYTPPQGGLAALAAAIGDYESQIVDYNRKRVENAGGDASKVRADFASGMLGDNPYLLLDYGGWERPNDPFGDMFVGLYFRLYTDLRYFAVGGKLYEQLAGERWAQYAALTPWPPLVVSAGQPQSGAPAAVPLMTREVYGQRWGVVMAPLPSLKDSDPDARMSQFVEQSAGVLHSSGCRFGVLLAAGGPDSLYKELAKDRRFTVVIGCKLRQAAAPGFGVMPRDGALLLPELQGGGRELGVCHVIWPDKGELPEAYHFELLKVEDDLTKPYPYRQLVHDTNVRHAELEAKWRAEHMPKQPPAGR